MNQKSVCFYLSKEFEAVGLADLLLAVGLADLKLARIHNPSNDEAYGFAHDIFCFFKYQELLSITQKFLKLLK